MRRLQDFFEEERSREPMISATQIDGFLKARGNDRAEMPIGSDRSNRTNAKGNIIMIATAIGLVAAATIGFLSWNSDEPGTGTGKVRSGSNREGIVRNTEEAKKRGEDRYALATESSPSSAALWNRSGLLNGREEERPNDREGVDEKDSNGVFRAPAPFISGIRMIELSKEELGQLGLQPDTAGVWYFWATGVSISGMQITMSGGVIPPPDCRGIIHEGTVAPQFQPIFVTDDYGNRRAEMFEDDDYEAREKEIEEKVREIEKQMRREMESEERYKLIMELNMKLSEERLATGNFIPIIVRTGRIYTDEDKANGRWRPDCIFWYEPSSKFLAALPERVRLPLERELRLASVLQGKPERESIDAFIDRQPLEIRQAFDSLRSTDEGSIETVTAGETYIGALGSASGAITFSSISPNPAHGQLFVQYTLATPRRVALALYDVNGKHIRTFNTAAGMRNGESLDVLSLEGISPGMYLLVISTEKEKAIQRVIVK